MVFLFATEPPADLFCPICMDLMRASQLLALSSSHLHVYIKPLRLVLAMRPQEATVTPFGHSYCRACITKEIELSGRCPFTRQALEVAQLAPNLVARSFIEELELICPYGCKLSADG